MSFLTKGHPDLSEQIGDLQVIARCICGCPTVAFGMTSLDEPHEGGGEVIAYHQGRAANGTLVGVHVGVDEGRIVELEGIGWDGDFEDWPAIEALVPGNAVPDYSHKNDSLSSQHHFPRRRRNKLTTAQKIGVLMMALLGMATLLRLMSWFVGRPTW